jgi:hypothetical protein
MISLPPIFSTPRPVPGRRLPLLVSGALVALALPVFVAGGFPIAGWILAAVLWAAGEALVAFLGRLPLGADHVGSSAVVGLAQSFRGVGVMIALLAVTVANRGVGISAVVLYVLAYTLSLAVSLVEYFVGGARR